MKIGFSIMSHQAPGPLFTKLLTQLNRYPDKEIAIHHDFFQSEFSKDQFAGLEYHLVENYVRTYWSHSNNIQAILETFKILYARGCDWYITLSANCYPIKSPSYILDFLSNAKVDGFIEHNNVLTDYYDFYQYFRKGFNTKYLFKIPYINRSGKFNYKAVRIPRPASEIIFNEFFTPYHGSDWFMINRRVIEHILESESKIQEMVRFFQEVNRGPDVNVCPPEMVFNTLAGNNKELKLHNDNFRFIDWTNSINWHPNILHSSEHFDFIRSSKGLFARKFDSEKSANLINRIDSEILEFQLNSQYCAAP